MQFITGFSASESDPVLRLQKGKKIKLTYSLMEKIGAKEGDSIALGKENGNIYIGIFPGQKKIGKKGIFTDSHAYSELEKTGQEFSVDENNTIKQYNPSDGVTYSFYKLLPSAQHVDEDGSSADQSSDLKEPSLNSFDSSKNKINVAKNNDSYNEFYGSEQTEGQSTSQSDNYNGVF